MPQMLRQDNIPKMVVASTTTATLAITSGGQSTSATIGGQQYTPASLLTLNAATVGANGLDAGSLGASQLWYVYAIVNQASFAVALLASLSTAPTMPTGYGTAYKLVGGFNTNASSQISFTVTPEDGNVYPVISTLFGRTDGAAVAAGYIGEKISATAAASFSGPTASGTFADITSLSISLTPGVWCINSSVLHQFSVSGVNTASGYRWGSFIRDASNNVIKTTELGSNPMTTSLMPVNLSSSDCFVPHIVVATTTTYKVSLRFVYSGGAADAGSKALDNRGDVITSEIVAVRIA